MSNLKIYIKSVLIPVLLGGIVGFLISGSMDYNSLYYFQSFGLFFIF